MLSQSPEDKGLEGASADEASKKNEQSFLGLVSSTLRQALTNVFIAGVSFSAGGEVQESHGGTCGCTGCLPPPRVSVEKVKKEDESGEP